MKITALETVRVELPIATPIKTAIHDIRSVGCVLVRLETDAGLAGEGYAFTLSALRLDVIEAMVQSLEGQVVGRDPHDVEAIWESMWRDVNFLGHKGITVIAMSAIDVACWDLVGKAAGAPLWRLFGACREDIEAYASGGLWLSLSLDELRAEAEGFLAQGFRAMKIRLGKASAEEDVERVAAVRAAIGPETGLMADANQGLTVARAIELGRRLEAFGLLWFEEPVACYDLAGHAEIARALDTPIASGESEYTSLGMAAMLDAEACDVLMPDLQRMGGYTELRKAAALAQARDVPISPHLFTEHSLAIAGSAPNCVSVEHMPWFATLFREPMALSDGRIAMPERPGTGFTFDPAAVARYRMG